MGTVPETIWNIKGLIMIHATFRPNIILPDGQVVDFNTYSEAGMLLKDEIRDELDKELIARMKHESNDITLRDNT